MKKVIYPLLLVFGLIVPLFIYLGWSLHSATGWVLISLLFSLVFSFPFFRHGHRLLKLTYLSMGILSYLIVFILLRDFVEIFSRPLGNGFVYVATAVALGIGSLIAHRGPRVVKLRLPIKDLPQSLSGLKIVQVSDLHVGPTIGMRYVQKVVEKVNALNPDLIALTGDIGDGPVHRYRKDITPLASLRSRGGVFYVPGNHEYYWNGNEWLNVMNNLRAIVLVNRGKKVFINDKAVFIGGISDPAGFPKPDLGSATQGSADSSFRLLLSHRPGVALEASQLGYHLQLSGHTHGGQFFPWTLVVRFVHRHFQGLHRVGSMWLNVNSGTGSWGPVIRLGTIPEISLIEIFQSEKSLE